MERMSSPTLIDHSYRNFPKREVDILGGDIFGINLNSIVMR